MYYYYYLYIIIYCWWNCILHRLHVQELIQNAEDARARIVKIVSVSKVSKPAQTPGRERERSGKDRAHHTTTSSSWRPPFVEVFSVSLHALTLQPAMSSSSSSSSNWILVSCQPHRVTSGQSNSGHNQIHISKLFSHIYQSSVKSIYKTNPFANIKHTYTNIRHKFPKS